MQEIRAGELLWKFRNEKGISTRRICKGICSHNAITNYEKGERKLDVLLLERFLERMGIVPSNFALMLNEEEYAYYVWRDACYRAVEDKQWDELERLLGEQIGLKKIGFAKIQKQFYAYMEAVVIANKYGQFDKAIELLLEAVHKTVSNINRIIQEEVYLGEFEIQIILLYLYYGLCSGQVSKEIANQLLQDLALYCDSPHLEDGVRTKTYVRIVCIWIKYEMPDMSDETKRQLCDKALDMIRKNYLLFDITELLDIYVSILKKANSDKVLFYQKQYKAFCEILLYAGMESKFRPEVVGVQSPKIYLISEYLQYKRRDKEMTQEKVSEGICEPETYSRLEKGGHSPLLNNMIALSERLEIGWHIYRGELYADNRRVYQLLKEVRGLEIKGLWRECLEVLDEMKRLLDMNMVKNYQFIYFEEIYIKNRSGMISPKEVYERDIELLRLTNRWNADAQDLVYYSQTELEIIGHMGQLLRKMGKKTEAIDILNKVINQMSQSKVSMTFHWDGVNYVLRVLSALYFSIEEYQKSYDILYQTYKETLHCYNGGNIVAMLANMLDSLEHIGTQHSNMCKKLCRLAYYAADFFDIPQSKKIVQEHYEKNYETEYKWY